MKFNETSPALTASQIKVERMIAQTNRIQKRIDEMKTTTSIGNGLHSFLTPAELKELRRCLKIAYPTQTQAQRKQKYQTLACQPTAAARFIKHADFQK